MKPLAFNLTPAAKTELVRFMARIRDFQPVVCVTWRISGSRGWIEPNGDEKIESLGPGWDVGFHDIKKLPPEELCELDGLQFIFDTGREFSRLHGATLDYTDEGFVVVESAA
jgi:hypothetical protein